jgi:hypothetical protein
MVGMMWARVLCVEPRGRRADAGGRYCMREGRQSAHVPMAGPEQGPARHGEERRKRDRRKGTHQHSDPPAVPPGPAGVSWIPDPPWVLQ